MMVEFGGGGVPMGYGVNASRNGQTIRRGTDLRLARAHTDAKTSPAEPAAKSTNQPHHIW